MAKFYRLQVIDGVADYQEVEGEAVDIGEDVQAFFVRPPSGEWSCLYDVVSGARITDIEDTDGEAIVVAQDILEHCGLNGYKRCQEHFRILYGGPPEPEIQIIQEPQLPGEIETCSRWSIYE